MNKQWCAEDLKYLKTIAKSLLNETIAKIVRTFSTQSVFVLSNEFNTDI